MLRYEHQVTIQVRWAGRNGEWGLHRIEKEKKKKSKRYFGGTCHSGIENKLNLKGRGDFFLKRKTIPSGDRNETPTKADGKKE